MSQHASRDIDITPITRSTSIGQSVNAGEVAACAGGKPTHSTKPAAAGPTSLCDKLAAYLIAHEGEWVDAHVLASIGGFAAWRTRLSELRRQRRMTIENRWIDNGNFRVTEYRYLPEAH